MLKRFPSVGARSGARSAPPQPAFEVLKPSGGFYCGVPVPGFRSETTVDLCFRVGPTPTGPVRIFGLERGGARGRFIVATGADTLLPPHRPALEMSKVPAPADSRRCDLLARVDAFRAVRHDVDIVWCEDEAAPEQPEVLSAIERALADCAYIVVLANRTTATATAAAAADDDDVGMAGEHNVAVPYGTCIVPVMAVTVENVRLRMKSAVSYFRFSGTGAGGSAWLADAPSYRRVPIYSSSHFRPAATAAAVGGRRAMGDTHRLDFMADTDAANGVGRGENDNRKDLPHDRDGTADAAPAADTAGAADAVAGVAAAADVDFIDAALQPLRVFLPAREPGPAATARRTVRNAMTFKEAIDAAPLDLISELRARGRRLEALVQQSPVQRALDERKRPLAQRRRGAH